VSHRISKWFGNSTLWEKFVVVAHSEEFPKVPKPRVNIGHLLMGGTWTVYLLPSPIQESSGDWEIKVSNPRVLEWITTVVYCRSVYR